MIITLIRKMIRSTIQRHSHLELVSEAEDGAQAIELAKKLVNNLGALRGRRTASEIQESSPFNA